MADRNPQKTILAYRRRRTRVVPMIFTGLAVLLLTAGLALAVLWWTQSGGGVALAPTETPRPTATPTTVAPSPSSTQAPSATPEPTATPTEESAPGTYTVKQGDTLIAIAERFGVNLAALMAVNNITDATTLSVGQVLTIPAPDAAPPSETPLPANLRPGTKIQHVVQSGETLQTIASRYNSTIAEIVKESQLTDPNRIQVGQILTVPVNIVTPTPTVPTPTPNPSQPTPTPSLTPTP